MTKTFLYITKYYPPTSSAAGIRAQRFVKALVDADYRVIVLTFSDDGGEESPALNPQVYRVTASENTLGGTTRIIPIHKSGVGVLPGPDPDKKCCQLVFEMGQRLLEKHQPDALLVSGPPFSFMAIARQLALRKNLPLILDFRDAWFSGMPWPYANRIRRSSARRWEHRCVVTARKIITATEEMGKILGRRYGREISDKCATVRHGFDSNAVSPEPGKHKSDKDYLTLVYTGQLRGIDIDAASGLYRTCQAIGHNLLRYTVGARFCEQLRLDWMSPLNLFKAIAQEGREDKRFLERIRLLFAGERFASLDRWARQYGIDKMVTQLGPMSPSEAQATAQQADLLLLNLYRIKGLDYHWCVPSKLYSYLGSGHPILALVPEGEAAELVRQSGTGIVVHPEDITGIRAALRALVLQPEQVAKSLKPNWDYIKKFDQDRQMEALLGQMNDLWSYDLKSS